MAVARDTRTYVRLHDGLPDHPKILAVGDLAGWLYVCGLCYCSRQLTDGVIPTAMVGRLTSLPGAEAFASKLLEANLWHAPGHGCETCPQPPKGHYIVHDYTEHQRSKAEVSELSAKRAAAGRKGGVASGEARNGQQNTKQVLREPLKQNEAETETETDREEVLRTSSTASRKRSASTPKRGTRIPDDFHLTDDMRNWGRENFPGVDGERVTAEFVDYWRGVPGQRGVKVDWIATWRNSIRRAAERTPPLANGHTPSNVLALPGTNGYPRRPSATERSIAEADAAGEEAKRILATMRQTGHPQFGSPA